MKKKLHDNICIILSCIMFGIFFIPNLFQTWKSITTTENFLSAVIAIFIGIIGVAFPIIIGNVGKTLSTYNNQYISNIFKEEKSYKRMFRILIFLSITIVVYFFYSTYKTHTWKLLTFTSIFIMCLQSVYAFYSFWKVFTEYIINTDHVVIQKITDKVDSLLEQKKPTKELLDYMDMYNQVLQTKLKSGSYVDLLSIIKKQTNLLLGVLDNLNTPIGDSGQTLGSDNYLKSFFTKYYLSTYSCWKKTFREASDETFGILIEYHKLLKDILLYRLEGNPEILNKKEFEPLFFLYQRMANDINKKTADSIPHAQTCTWDWYTSLLSDPELSPSLLPILDIYLLATMKIVVKTKNRIIFESFIAATIDKLWFHNDDLYSENSEMTKTIQKIKEELPGTIFPQRFETLKKLVAHIEDEEEKVRIQETIHEKFRYNHISFTVTILGAYCLFRTEYGFIEYILKYNQPDNSTTQYINKDIVPTDINVLLKLYKNYPSFIPIFFNIWEGHNDGQLWFRKYISLLVCNLVRTNHLKTKYRKDSDANKQDLEYDKICICDIKSILSDDYNESDIINAIGLTQENRVDAIKFLENISEQITESINKEKKQQKLDKEKVKTFEESIRADIQDRSIWLNILQETLLDESSKKFEVNIGDKRLIEKSFLAKNDNGLYFGFSHGFSEIILNQINYHIENYIRVASQQNPEAKLIDKTNFKEKIMELDETWIVLFINYPFIFDWVYNIQDFQTIFKDNLVGITGKGTHIYTTNDLANTGTRVIIFRKAHISKVSMKLKIDITNLNENGTQREKIIKQKPNWLDKYHDDKEKEEILRCSALIHMSGKLSFSIAEKASIFIFWNI